MFCTLRVPPRFERSGPRMLPLPLIMWQEPQLRLAPRRALHRAATSPCAGASMAVPRRPRMYAVTRQICSSVNCPPVRRHLRAGNAVLDRIEDLLVGASKVAAILRGDRRTELSASAVLPVARRARLVVELLAFGDGLAVADRGMCGRCGCRRTAASLARSSGDTTKSREQRAKSKMPFARLHSALLCVRLGGRFVSAILSSPQAAQTR